MLIGYARVSTLDQSTSLQRDALTAAGCLSIFTDTASGSKDDRPGLAAAMAAVVSGDVLTVWKLDRLGRSLSHLLATVDELKARGVGFRTLTESFDTTTAGGVLIFQIFGALAQFERTLIRERTIAGIASAKARGRVGGRPPKLSRQQIEHAKTLIGGGASVRDVALTLRVSKATVYRGIGGN